MIPMEFDGTSPLGRFSSKEAYRMNCIHAASLPHFENWSWIWKIPANPRIVHFMWLVAHGRLATKDI